MHYSAFHEKSFHFERINPLIFLSAIFLPDVNECLNPDLHICDPAADCTNKDGGYTCSCNEGYYGNGVVCEGMWHAFKPSRLEARVCITHNTKR